MIKITHYEVYTDTGSGWQLIDRFAAEQRQEAFNLAKEQEQAKLKTKIIKEVFDVQDNSYQESVEYVSNLSKGGKGGKSSGGGDVPVGVYENVISGDVPVKSVKPKDNVFTAIIKLVALIILCLVLANLLVGLIFPVIESFIPEENNKPILFTIFFVLFLSIAVPLILKQVPWYVFTEAANARRSGLRPVSEKKFYDRAEDLLRLYNLNDDVYPIATPAFPEAPLEYKHYIVSFLSELLTQLQSPSAMQNNFSKLGLKLLIYGGCLEMARYSGLTISEANSLLYEAFKIIDGDNADLEAFYEAKHSYRDNKVAIFLTGVGAYVMSHIIAKRPLPTDILNVTFNKWEKQNQELNTDYISPELEPQGNDDIFHDVLVSIKSDLKFMDTSIPNQNEVAVQTSSEIRNIIFNLLGKYKGTDAVEDGGITSIRFRRLNYAVKFAVECLKDIATYQEETNNEALLLRNCCVLTEDKPGEAPNLSDYLADMFEHVYNNEIVVTAPVHEALAASDYKFDFLGEKAFARQGTAVALYKLLD